MQKSGERIPKGSVSEAEASFRSAAEQLAVRLRWVSIVAIPLLAYLSRNPVASPWFEMLVVSGIGYNMVVARSLARRPKTAVLSVGTALQDSFYLTALSLLSGGLGSVLTLYMYLAMVSVCMRLPVKLALGIAGLYTGELTFLAWMDGRLADGVLPVKIAYVFLTVIFVVPLVQEARAHLAEALAANSAQRRLLHRLLRLEEEERRRIAGELHDRGGGALFSLLHGLRRLRGLVRPTDSTVAVETDRLIGVVEASVQDLRTLLADLRPRLLDDLGLAEALRDLLTRERSLSGLSVSFEVDGEVIPDPESAMALYRVAQEAFTNIRRHAGARSAAVRLGHDNGSWMLSIEDDGTGISGRSSGLGLRTMRERVEALGGRFEIQMRPAGGTVVCARVPRNRNVEGNDDSRHTR